MAQPRFPLQSFIKEDSWQWWIVACCLLIFIGFVTSRALVSIGMMALLSASLLYYGPATFKNYFARKELWILSLFFWVVLFSGLYSEDKAGWMNWVRIKLPYLALPLAFAPVKKLNAQQMRVLLYGFIGVFFVSTAVVLLNYYRNYEAITDSFTRGNGIPMPFSHIRYTLMLSFSFFCCLWLLEKKEEVVLPFEKWLLLFFAAFAFLSLHILSVRSGLLGLYAGILFLSVREAVRRKKILQSVLIVGLVGCLPFLAYHYVPAFHNKIEYMKYDLAQYREGKANNYSDALRLISMKVGIQIWNENPLLGAGAGDIKTETHRIYADRYPDISVQNRRIPHNQFIWMLATTGLVGILLFMIAFLTPLLSNHHYRLWILLLLHLILFTSFFTEDTLEEQMGTGFYLIFLLLFMNYCRRDA